MKLYHFTSWYGFLGIADRRIVRKGKVFTGGHVKPLAVSLTTNPSNRLLGIPDGRQLEPHIAGALDDKSVGIDQKTGTHYCVDHTAFRFAFEIQQDDPNLVNVSDFYAQEPESLFALGLSATHPFYSLLEASQQDILAARFLSDRYNADRTDQWWYYLEDLPMNYLVGLDLKTGDDAYEESAPIDELVPSLR